MSTLPDYPANAHQTNIREFLSLASRVGLDLGAMVDPRTELSFAVACRICSKCTSKERCRRVVRQSNAPLGAVASFCPSFDVLVELMHRQPASYPTRARAA
jgi:hypothetical protein